MNLRVVVFGGEGRLAAEIRRWSCHDIVLIPSTDCDIRNAAQIRGILEEERPQIAINCAAYANQQYCEAHREEIWEVNVDAVANIAMECDAQEVLSVHISSDAALDPVNVYAQSKLASEEQGCDLTVRTSYYTLDHWLFRSLRSGEAVQLSTADVLNPISAYGLAWYLDMLMESKTEGLVSVGTHKCLNHFQWGTLVATAGGYPLSLISKADYITTPFPYPTHRCMSLQSLVALDLPLTSMEDDLRRLNANR